MDISLEFVEKKALLKVEGIISADNAYLFQEKLNEVLKSESRFLEIDFSHCRNISSTGIGKLLLFYKEFLAKNGEIEIIKSSPSVYELFVTIKLNQLFNINL